MSSGNKTKRKILVLSAGSSGGERYQTHVRWLRDSHFLRDLEQDNIDSDVINEELDTLRTNDTPLTRRERLVKFLRSDPVQTFLCAIVLVDASIVIAQILLDINSVKDQLAQRESDLSKLFDFLNADDDFTGNGITSTVSDDRRHANEPEIGRVTAHNCDRQPCHHAEKFEPGVEAEYVDRKSRDSAEVEKTPNNSSAVQHNSIYSDPFRQVAHSLHYVSIVLLGILLLEDVVRIIALGKHVSRHRLELFDALVVAMSFTVHIVFVGGITGDHGQKAAAALFVLLVWRVARVVDGIIVTVKQRQEFRIRLQRRARCKAEKKIDAAEDEKQQMLRELETLQSMCLRAGIKSENIEAVCSNSKSPRRSRMLQAFSSVARLSYGVTMPFVRSSSVDTSSCHHSPQIPRNPSDGFLSTHCTFTYGAATPTASPRRHRGHQPSSFDDDVPGREGNGRRRHQRNRNNGVDSHESTSSVESECVNVVWNSGGEIKVFCGVDGVVVDDATSV